MKTRFEKWRLTIPEINVKLEEAGKGGSLSHSKRMMIVTPPDRWLSLLKNWIQAPVHFPIFVDRDVVTITGEDIDTLTNTILQYEENMDWVEYRGDIFITLSLLNRLMARQRDRSRVDRWFNLYVSLSKGM